MAVDALVAEGAVDVKVVVKLRTYKSFPKLDQPSLGKHMVNTVEVLLEDMLLEEAAAIVLVEVVMLREVVEDAQHRVAEAEVEVEAEAEVGIKSLAELVAILQFKFHNNNLYHNNQQLLNLFHRLLHRHQFLHLQSRRPHHQPLLKFLRLLKSPDLHLLKSHRLLYQLLQAQAIAANIKKGKQLHPLRLLHLLAQNKVRQLHHQHQLQRLPRQPHCLHLRLNKLHLHHTQLLLHLLLLHFRHRLQPHSQHQPQLTRHLLLQSNQQAVKHTLHLKRILHHLKYPQQRLLLLQHQRHLENMRYRLLLPHNNMGKILLRHRSKQADIVEYFPLKHYPIRIQNAIMRN